MTPLSASDFADLRDDVDLTYRLRRSQEFVLGQGWKIGVKKLGF